MREIALNHVGNLRNSGLGEDVIKLLEKPKPKPTGNDSIALYRYLDVSSDDIFYLKIKIPLLFLSQSSMVSSKLVTRPKTSIWFSTQPGPIHG